MDDSRPTEDTTTLKLELEFERLEREWLERRLRYEKGQAGQMRLFGGIGIVGGIIVVGFGLWDLFVEGQVAYIYLGILLLGVGAVEYWYFDRKVKAYNEAKQWYEHYRKRLLKDIVASRRRGHQKEENDQSAD